MQTLQYQPGSRKGTGPGRLGEALQRQQAGDGGDCADEGQCRDSHVLLVEKLPKLQEKAQQHYGPAIPDAVGFQ